MGNRLVIVSHVFAPSTHANAKRPYMMAKYLATQGWDVTVLTSSFQRDSAAKRLKDMDDVRVECFNPFPLPLMNWLLRYPSLYAKMHLFFQAIFFPDYYAPWARRVARRLKKMQYDCGILNVMPYSSFLLQEQGILGPRWAIDYQEIVYPFLERKPRRSPLQKKRTPELINQERMALKACGSVWFTSKSAMKRYINDNAVDEGKTACIPCFYDPALYKAVTPVQDGLLTVLYGGDFSSPYRSPEPFFKAWAAVRRQSPEAFSAIRLVVYGHMADACRRRAVELGLWGQIDIRGRIPYADFLNQAARADALLYFDSSEQEFFSPGKLADYFGAARPILAITAEGSGVEIMLKDAGLHQLIWEPSDVDAGAACLVRLWESVQNREESLSSRLTNKYSLPVVCEQADRILETLIQPQAE